MKKITLLLLSILILLSVVVLAILLPAHSQIRAIEPPLPELAAIQAALEVEPGPVSIHYINSASQSGPGTRLGHPGVLVSWPSGKQFLIDTGMRPDAAIAFGKSIELVMGADPAVPHGSLAEQLGEAVDSVAGIAFTHLHSDHTDGLGSICASQRQPAIVYQVPLQYREQNHTTTPGLDHLQGASCARQELEGKEIMPVPGFPGLIAISLGGHTPGSTLYVVKLEGSYWMFSGDITNDKASILRDLPKHWLYSTFIVPEHVERTALLRQWLRDLDAREDIVVLPAHDVDTMADHLPSIL